MASSQLVWVLETVVQLDRELARVLAHVDVLAMAAVPEAVVIVRSAHGRVLASMRELRERVLASADETAIEWAESVLRARAMVVLLQVVELLDAESELAPAALGGVGRFGSASALGAHLLGQIGQVNAAWMRERRDLRAKGIAGVATDALHHIVLDNAECAFAAIGRDKDVEGFLQLGAAVGSSRFRTVCRTIAAALDVPLVPELPRLVRGGERLPATSGEVER